MRKAHGYVSFRAVAAINISAYHGRMKSMHSTHKRSDTATSRTEGHAAGFNDPHAVTSKALERWENEGGRIPEFAAGSRSDRAERPRRY